MDMRYTSIPFTFLLAFAIIACDKKEELPTEPPLPTTQQPADNFKPVNYQINPASFNGFGPAQFGSDEESVRMSWGRPLIASKPAKGSSCYQVHPDTKAMQRPISFMIEEGQFVRYDVYDRGYTAPGNIKVGDSSTAIMQAYAGNVHDQPHKYAEGARTLIVTPPHAPKTRLIFETDANDKVTEWRIGMPPQVYYVEGCS